MIILEVALHLPIKKLFKYIIPSFMNPTIGSRVIVPFGSKYIIGIIVSCSKKINSNSKNYKYIKLLIDKKSFYTHSLLKILIWLRKNYFFYSGIIFFSILPNFLIKNYIIFKNSYQRVFIQEELYIKKINRIFIKKAYKKHFLNKNKLNISRKIVKKNFFLNAKIVIQIRSIVVKNKFLSFLVTKTNLLFRVKFYLGLIEKVLKKNLQILILVPFIKDACRILFFLKKYFNVYIDVIHSKFNEKKYFLKWIRTKKGINSIIIGTKKSVFFPFLKLGLIIVMEEHNIIYKNLDQFPFHARNVAILRAYKENIPIILDSHTPSLKTLYNVIHKKCTLITFNKNSYDSNILNNKIINLQKENIVIGLSASLIHKIFKVLKKNYPVLLIFHKLDLVFLGLVCRNCKWIATCNVCNNYFETKKYSNFIFCKNCLISLKKPLFCMNCNHLSLSILNFGIKKIKNNIKKIFPKISLFFLLNKKLQSIEKLNKQLFKVSFNHACVIFARIENFQKYYFPYVKLIGFVNIDCYLNSLNLFSTEYFSQLYYSLKNIIGKKIKKCKVYIQTYLPENKFLRKLCSNEYFFFIRNRLILRKKFLLPPWSCQALIISTSKVINQSVIFLYYILIILKKKFKEKNIPFWFIEPHPVFLKNNKKFFSYQLLIQCKSHFNLKTFLQDSIDIVQYFAISKNVQWFVDFDSYQ